MKQRIISILGRTTRSLDRPESFKILVITSFIILFLCLILLKLGERIQDQTGNLKNLAITPVATIPTISSTKWWIKTTPTVLSTSLGISVLSNPSERSESDCSSKNSSPLQLGRYAYISLTPPLPNRVRAGAGKANAYLGQIQPGAGVKIIGGPLCVDGFSWWLVEAVEGDLQGWTATGSNSAQWVLPCPNPTVPCKMAPVISPATQTIVPSSTQNNNKDSCHSETLSIGMLTQVEQDNLLVVRSEPYVGSVIGYAGPMSAVRIVDGPACVGGAVWWEVNIPSLNLTGWATEANLQPCTKEDDCT